MARVAQYSGDVKVAGDLELGNLTSPVKHSAGSGAMTTTNKPNGSAHFRTDGLIETLFNSVVRKLGLADRGVELRMGTLTANQANTYISYMPHAMTITDVKRRFTLKPASAAGTVVTGITIGGNQILNSASEDEEGITNDTLTSYALTGTAAHLVVDAGDKIVVTTTSDNADMTDGTDMMLYIFGEDN